MTIPRECKRLAEVDFPIAVVSKHAVREKSIRHGHPSTLHLWWARRPLASCRAMLLALLLPDPCDPHCPPEFKARAREALRDVERRPLTSDEELRQALLRFIGDFANWDLSSDPRYLEAGRGLVRAAYADEPPLVVDPFAGGGSIPLEALRLGCEAFASDLNPVACLILKVLLEDIPRHGPQLAEELRRAGKEIKQAAERELAQFYPPDPDGARPIAYLWARTVRCETPGCGAEIPLMRSCWLSKKANRRRALRYRAAKRDGAAPEIELEIFEPKTESEVQRGTVSRAKATCPACSVVLGPERVRAQLVDQRGGADVVFDEAGKRAGGARLFAVVTTIEGERGRQYRAPSDDDYTAVRRATARLRGIEGQGNGASGHPAIPNEPLPPVGTLGFRVQRYGMLKWGDLYAARQAVAIVTLAQHITRVDDVLCRTMLAFALSKQADFNSSLSRWANHMEKSVATFGRQALPMLWDWGEVVPFSDSTGGFSVAIDWIANGVETVQRLAAGSGVVQQAGATALPLPDASASVVFTDPPYYDAVPYSDLSDYFFVWLKRVLPMHPLLRDPFDHLNPLTPKDQEAVMDPSRTVEGRRKDRFFFEETMARAFAEQRRILTDESVSSVVFAHKTTAGWEALLSGMISSGLTITASWPIATEKPNRMRAQDSAALATSVHLV